MTNILDCAKKRNGKGKLKPVIVPKKKLGKSRVGLVQIGTFRWRVCFWGGIFWDPTSRGALNMKECVSQFSPSFPVPRITAATEEKHTSDKTSQTTQQCLGQLSPPDSNTPLVQAPQVTGVKTESIVKVEQNLELPIKKEPEEEEPSEKDGGPLGIKILECWSLQGIKEEPMDALLVSHPPPYTAANGQGGAADMPKIKQEAGGGGWEEWQSAGCPAKSRKRPSAASEQLREEEPGAESKKFRPLHQPPPPPPPLAPCEGRPNPIRKEPEGAWPVKVEKDVTSHDFPAESEGEWETLGPCCVLEGHQFIRTGCCGCTNSACDQTVVVSEQRKAFLHFPIQH